MSDKYEKDLLKTVSFLLLTVVHCDGIWIVVYASYIYKLHASQPHKFLDQLEMAVERLSGKVSEKTLLIFTDRPVWFEVHSLWTVLRFNVLKIKKKQQP